MLLSRRQNSTANVTQWGCRIHHSYRWWCMGSQWCSVNSLLCTSLPPGFGLISPASWGEQAPRVQKLLLVEYLHTLAALCLAD